MDTQPVSEPAAGPPLHPLAEAAERSLLAARPDELGFVRPRAGGCFDVAVALASVPRAARLLQRLLAKAEAAGIVIRVDREKRRTLALVDGLDLAIQLVEGKRRLRHKATSDERARAKRDSWFQIPEWDHLPDGNLTLRVVEPSPHGARRRWTDGRRGLLEGKLDSLMAGLKAVAAAQQREVARWAQVARERAEQQRRDAEAAARQRREDEFRDGLVTEAEAWERACLLRAYVNAVVDRIRACGSTADNTKLDGWVEHALDVADSLDPLEWIEVAPHAAAETQSR